MAEKKTTEATENQQVETEVKEPAKKKAEPKKKGESAKLQAELDKANEALAESKDMLLRTAAEFDNFKRRTEKEKADIAAFVKADVVKALLPVADNIERAGQSDSESADYVKGLEMIIKQLTDTLDRVGLKKIEAEGAQFDPNFHEAVMHVEDDSVGENTVVQVLQTGYMMGDTVIRPAMVKVAN